MIEAIIFDIDGTLIDSVDYHAEAWLKTFAERGRNIDFSAVRLQIGKGADELLPVFFSKQEIDEFGKEMADRRGEIFKSEYLDRIKPFPKVRDLFQRILDEGKRIALASSANKDELKKYKEIARIGDLIEAETSADDAERSKPNPDIFQAAMDELGNVNANNVLVVGDTPYDAEAAGKIDIRTIGVLCGGFPEKSLTDAGCIAIYKNPAELLENYENSPISKKP